METTSIQSQGEHKTNLFFEHGGDLEQAAKFAGCNPGEIVDFSNLLNPMGTPWGLEDYLKEKLSNFFKHPSSGEALRAKISEKFGVPQEQILLGAGTTEFIRYLPLLRRPRRPVILGPTYGDYESALRMAGSNPQWVMALEEKGWAFPHFEFEKILETKPDWIILARPNNPLGQNWPMESLLQSIKSHPEVFFVVDETCLEISENPQDSFANVPLPANLAVLGSFSKTYAVPGIRLGWMVVPLNLSELFRRLQTPWTVSPLALEAGLYLLNQGEWLLKTQKDNPREKNRVYAELSTLKNFKVFPSAIPAFTIKGTAVGFSSLALLKQLLEEEKILIRSLVRHPGLGDAYFRIGLRTSVENDRLIGVLKRLDNP